MTNEARTGDKTMHGDNKANDWTRVETLVAEYVEDYEYCGEDEQGREGFYTPKEHERDMIADAISGLLSEPEFVAAFRACTKEPQA